MPIDFPEAELIDRYRLGVIAGERAHDVFHRADRDRSGRIGRGKDSLRDGFEDAQLRGFENRRGRPRCIVGIHARTILPYASPSQAGKAFFSYTVNTRLVKQGLRTIL